MYQPMKARPWCVVPAWPRALAALPALLLLLLPLSAAPADRLVGAAAPDFALRSFSGSNVRLSEHLGEVVILNFWATWCGPCRQEMPELDAIYQKYRLAGLALFSVNLDEDRAAAIEMAQTLEVSYPVLFDERKEASRSYQIGTMPVTALIDRAGRVRYVSAGYKPGYEQRYAAQLRELLNE
jgi:thiol-disulfide isomerase/thioredoxin